MSILINKDTRVITQGITGKTGQFHTRMCRDYANGKNCFVAGVNPKKAGEDFEGIPIFASVKDAKAQTGATVSVIYVPPAGAADAELAAKVIRHLDWILPRSHALIRHKAERYDPDLEWRQDEAWYYWRYRAEALHMLGRFDEELVEASAGRGRYPAKQDLLLAEARALGGKIETGGGRPAGQNKGYFFEPTVISGLPESARAIAEESDEWGMAAYVWAGGHRPGWRQLLAPLVGVVLLTAYAVFSFYRSANQQYPVLMYLHLPLAVAASLAISLLVGRIELLLRQLLGLFEDHVEHFPGVFSIKRIFAELLDLQLFVENELEVAFVDQQLHVMLLLVDGSPRIRLTPGTTSGVGLDAVQALVAMDVVEVRVGAGTFVKPLRRQVILDTDEEKLVLKLQGPEPCIVFTTDKRYKYHKELFAPYLTAAHYNKVLLSNFAAKGVAP